MPFFSVFPAPWFGLPIQPTGRPPGNKAEEFDKINKEWTDLIANLGALKNEYATSTDAARKAEIHKQYDEGIEKAKAMEGKVVAAAENAYAEAPNADPKIVEVLVATLYDLWGTTIMSPPTNSAKCSWTTSAPRSTSPRWPAWPPSA